MKKTALLLLCAAALSPAGAAAQWERVTHQAYLPAPHNWEFREHYPAADGLFNAFDFGHGILYERLFSEPNAPVDRLEVDTYDELVGRVLRNPPRLPMPEQAFMPNYARLAPRAKEMFDWAHVLHRQIYDIYADDRITDKVAAVDEAVDYYLTRGDVAFPDVPKSMAIMDGQSYSTVFRARYPKFNGLIWAYHWLQLAIYEPLLTPGTEEERSREVSATIDRFWQMLESPPANLPASMPMAPGVAPTFTAKHPRAAAIFDNLHMMHDVISDILTSREVTDKRAAIEDATRQFTDPAHLATTREEWIQMASAHAAMGAGSAPGAVADPHAGHVMVEPAAPAAAPPPDAATPPTAASPPASAGASPSAAPAPAPAQQEADVRALARGFKDALARGDSTAALGFLSDDALILEGGRSETKEQYRSGHLAADIRFASGVQSETLGEGVTLHGDVALYTRSYRSTGTSARGAPIDRTSAEAMELVRTAAGWRIRSIHWF